MPALPLAMDIADAALNTDIFADLEATARQLRDDHPEAEADHADVVAALVAAGKTSHSNTHDLDA